MEPVGASAFRGYCRPMDTGGAIGALATPTIPAVGEGGVPMTDEIECELGLGPA